MRSMSPKLREKLETASENSGLSMAAITKLALAKYLEKEKTWPDGLENRS